MFKNVYRNKKVLITGHTGFKGAWLTVWLLKLGAKVVGVSKYIPSNPSMFEELKLKDKVKNYQEDIRDLSKIKKIISDESPDFLFHLAAQPIVSHSFINPIETITTNVIGTANILESLIKSNHNCIAIIITSDKAYDNVEQLWGYREIDLLGGKDIYSGSKGAAELIIKSYFYSFFCKSSCNTRIAIGRAGNVIGGGDWADDRIVVDCMKSWSVNKKVKIRSPNSTRPWQHVLEPLSGYLNLGQYLLNDASINGEAFNFGPLSEESHSVQKLIGDLSKFWRFESLDDAYEITDNIPFSEAGLLKLNCDKALFKLDWKANLNYQNTIEFTSDWYFNFYNGTIDSLKKTEQQIYDYELMAENKGLKWTG